MNKLDTFLNMNFVLHLVLGGVIRLMLIMYAEYHDNNFEVPYTDIDYKVFSDAAYYVSRLESPYKRQTYRYSPLIAYLLIPNFVFGINFGKVLFCVFDILITIAVKHIVEHQFIHSKQKARKIANYCSLFWLYNPLSIAISTRGNADSVSCFLIIMSIYFLQTDAAQGFRKYILSGVALGVAIHLRIYPIAFSFPMYLSLGEYKVNRSTRFRDCIPIMFPNIKQMTLAFSCLVALYSLVLVMFHIYGYEFLFETYLFHLFRKDTRHNFSVMFYYSYLTMDQLVFDMVKNLTQIFEIVILFGISIIFGTDPQTLPFAMFTQAVVLVTYNTVMTSQYFIWFISLLPLVVHNFKMRSAKALFLIFIWAAAQGLWLFSAYLLEFKGMEVFIYIWLKGVIFFCVNIYVLGELISSYIPGYGFGQSDCITHDHKHGS